MSPKLYCSAAWIIEVRSICLLQARSPESAVGISLFSFHLMHIKVMDRRGLSKCEGCTKWSPHV